VRRRRCQVGRKYPTGTCATCNKHKRIVVLSPPTCSACKKRVYVSRLTPDQRWLLNEHERLRRVVTRGRIASENHALGSAPAKRAEGGNNA
jgi:hypothetical protein